jgi:hypothetical protein
MTTEELPGAWQAQHFRLITFPIEPQLATEQNWWNELTGTERETRSDRREVREEVGAFDGASLSLTIEHARLIWTISPCADRLGNLPVIGPFNARKDSFFELMRRWIAISPPVRRIAVAGVLVLPVPERRDGIEILHHYVALPPLPPEATDLMFRINLPTDVPFNTATLPINRLTTWAVGTFTMIQAQIVPAMPASTTRVKNVHALTFEFDINTAAEFDCSAFSADELIAVVDALVAETDQLAARGVKNLDVNG